MLQQLSRFQQMPQHFQEYDFAAVGFICHMSLIPLPDLGNDKAKLCYQPSTWRCGRATPQLVHHFCMNQNKHAVWHSAMAALMSAEADYRPFCSL